MEGRQLGLRYVPDLAVLLRGAGLVEATVRRMLANGFEASKRTKTSNVSGHHGRAPRFGDEGHGAEVVEFIGLGLGNSVVNGILVGQITVEEVEVLVAHQVVDEAATRGGLGDAAHQSVDGVALLEKEFCEVGAVLSRHARDHRGLAAHVAWQMVSLFKRSPQCRASPWSQILLERTYGLPSDRTATDGWRRTNREQIMKLETSGPCAGRKHVASNCSPESQLVAIERITARF